MEEDKKIDNNEVNKASEMNKVNEVDKVKEINKENKNLKCKHYKTKIVTMGLITGLLSGLFASGGGIIAVPSFVHIFRLSEKEARAMSILCILPMVIVSMIMYHQAEYINYKIGILCGIGGLIGGALGSHLLQKIKDKYLQLFFIIFLTISAILIIIK